jgi:acyl carrier protein
MAANPVANLERELAEMLVEVLHLDLAPAAIDPQGGLFGEQGLGLDSIDILEMAVAISQRYGFQLRSDDPDNKRIFASLRALGAHVARHRTQ